MNQLDWTPERKIVAGAIAVLILFVLQALTGVEVPIGIEGALAILTGYFVPNKKAE